MLSYARQFFKIGQFSTRLTSKTKSVTLHFFSNSGTSNSLYHRKSFKKNNRLENFSENFLQVKTLIHLFNAWRRPRRYRRRRLSTYSH